MNKTLKIGLGILLLSLITSSYNLIFATTVLLILATILIVKGCKSDF